MGCQQLICIIFILFSIFITLSHQDTVRIQSCNYTSIDDHTCLNVTECSEITRVLETHFSSLKIWNPMKLINEFDCNTTSVEVCCHVELPKADECNFRRPIDNDTRLGDFPWDVQLYYDVIIKPLCGGVLISKRFVLTTAYCALGRKSDHKLKFLRFGEYDTSKSFDCENLNDPTCINQLLDIDFTYLTIHPDYSPITRDNDVALIRLSREIESTEYIRPICLDTNLTPISDNILGTGWGRNYRGVPNDVKSQFEFGPTDKSYCNRRFHISERHDFECTVAYNTSPEAHCIPELGNAVLIKKQETVYLKGIVSQTTSCMSQAKKLVVITSIDPHMAWIAQNVNI